MEAAAVVDFHALSRRELQALCKRNGVRANMTNAAMAEALQSLPSVDGIDEIGTTLSLPTPGRSTMKSALKAAAAVGEDQQQHGSPLPRGRRVSVKSPEAIRMDVEEGEDEMKRYLVKEIVRTPGVVLRSTSRRARATPGPIPTPATLRSQMTAARKAAAPVEEVMSTAKRTTRRSARSKVMIDLDQEEEVEAPPEEEKVQEEEPKGVASDEKCDEPEEEEVTSLLKEGNNKEEEPEQDEEVVSSVAPIASAVVSDRSGDDPMVEEMVVVMEEVTTKPREVAGTGEEQKLVSVERPDPMPTMEDSPILGVLSKAEAAGPVIEKAEDASVGDGGEDFGEWSPVKDITEEINRVSEDKAVAAVEVSEEAIKEYGFVFTGETGDAASKMLPAALTDDETTEEDDLDEETSEEDDLDEEEETTDEMSQADMTGDGTSAKDELEKEKGGAPHEMQQADLTDYETSAEIDSTYETEEENGEIHEESDSIEETTEETTNDSSGEEDDFSGDLPPEFDNVGNFSDAETGSDTAPPVPEEILVAIASSASKAAVKSLDDSAITEELEVSSERKVASTLDTIVKSLDEFTMTEGQVTREKCEPEAKEKKKKQLKAEDLGAKSLRKLKAMLKEELIAAKEEKKRLPLAELDDNACVDC